MQRNLWIAEIGFWNVFFYKTMFFDFILDLKQNWVCSMAFKKLRFKVEQKLLTVKLRQKLY